MDIKNHRRGIILTTLIISISVLVVLTILISCFGRTNLSPPQPTNPEETQQTKYTPLRPTTQAYILLKKVEFSENESEHLEIVESDLEQYPLLAKVLDAWENPDKYENASMRNNNTLIYNTTDTEADKLTDFIQQKLYEKYSRAIHSPYYLEYNQEFYSYREAVP